MKKKNQRQEEERSKERLKLLFILTLFFLGLPSLLFADTRFEFNDACISIHQEIYELKLDHTQARLDLLAEQDKDNLVVDLLTHLNLTLKAFISESRKDHKAAISYGKKAYRRIASSHSSSPYRNFALAEINFQSSLLLARKNKQLKAAQHLNQAYKQLKTNKLKFPDFLLNNKTEGLINCYLSTVPDNFKWAVNLLGVQGNLDAGLKQLKDLAYTKESRSVIGHYDKEAAYYYSYTLTHIAHDNETAWQVVQDCITDHSKSSLSAFFAANTGFKVFKNKEVITILKEAPTSNDRYPVHLLKYMLGSAKLYALDKSAIQHFEAFRKAFKGKNFQKANLQKMSWYYKVFGNETLHEKYKAMIPKTGSARVEEDKTASAYAVKPTPSLVLLKARLLFDGGYYSQAKDLIKPFKAKDFKSVNEKTEYCYRKGRIYHQLNKIELANMYYEACSKYGKKSTEYHAAYACLYLGEYYLSKGDNTKALKYYEMAQTYRDNVEYTQSIEVKAKIGIAEARAL